MGSVLIANPQSAIRNPPIPWVHFNLGAVIARSGVRDEAISRMKEIASLRPAKTCRTALAMTVRPQREMHPIPFPRLTGIQC